jgi:DNA repair protein RecN
MITTLHIKNIGIIDDLSINLNQGLNIVTGETGAGKTLIIDSLGILAGNRFSKEMIRSGEDYSYVELCLFLPEYKEAIDGNIIITREIYSSGRNLCKINGRLVTVAELKEFMKAMIDIHGQQDNQKLLDEQMHIRYLDDFAGEALLNIKQQYKELYKKQNEILKDLKNNYGDDKEKQRKLDLLRYQFNEIEEAKLKPNEEEDLQEKRSKMLNAEKIKENLSQASICIEENAIDSISVAIRSLEKIENLDKKYEMILNSLKSSYYELQEVARDLASQNEENDFNEIDRNQIEERLDFIFSLKRKYGNNILEILNYQKEIEKEINEIENLEEYTTSLKKELKQVQSQMLKLAINMNQIRKEYAKILSEKINQELADLEMKNARFYVEIQSNEENQFNKNGFDTVHFLISTNIGEAAKPLIKIASGGEMSRIMLAIKTVLADVDKTAVLVFDEIDTGISGLAANKVAMKLKKIAKNHQVLCVTHLASIAAAGDHNYYIFKKIYEQKTKTEVKTLDEQETLSEIARISSGEITEISLNHAKELRKKIA